MRTYKVHLCTDTNSSEHQTPFPNSPYSDHIIYPGQVTKCFLIQPIDHQVQNCLIIKRFVETLSTEPPSEKESMWSLCEHAARCVPPLWLGIKCSSVFNPQPSQMLCPSFLWPSLMPASQKAAVQPRGWMTMSDQRQGDKRGTYSTHGLCIILIIGKK